MFRFSLIIIWAVLLLVAIIFLAIYYVIYTKKINQRICEGKVNGKKMPDFPKTIMTIVIILLLSICIINAVTPVETTTSRNDFAVIDTSNYSYIASSDASLDDASFANLFSEKENAGYVREEFQDGDFHFIVFTSQIPSDAFHPDFLCYISYVGNAPAGLSLNGQFVEPVKNAKTGVSWLTDYTDHTLLIIGNYEKDNKFILQMGAYDEFGVENYLNSTDSDEEMESFALSVGSVLIENDQ